MNPYTLSSFILFCTIIGLTGWGCSSSPTPEALETSAINKDSLQRTSYAEQIQLTLYELDKAVVHLYSPHAATFEEQDGATLTKFTGGVRVEVIDSLGQRTLSRCNEVRYKSPESILTLAGDVRIDGFNGRKLSTDTLIWDRSTRNIRTEGFIIMVTENDSIRGFGLRATSDLSDYSILNVTGSTTLKRSSSL